MASEDPDELNLMTDKEQSLLNAELEFSRRRDSSSSICVNDVD